MVLSSHAHHGGVSNYDDPPPSVPSRSSRVERPRPGPTEGIGIHIALDVTGPDNVHQRIMQVLACVDLFIPIYAFVKQERNHIWIDAWEVTSTCENIQTPEQGTVVCGVR